MPKVFYQCQNIECNSIFEIDYETREPFCCVKCNKQVDYGLIIKYLILRALNDKFS
ncbi:MAG: hypothetical protein AABX17_03920 [Nanoarchaeota archaeon]